MRRELLVAPKFAVPLAILLWLLVSLSLWLLVIPKVEAQSSLPLGKIGSSDPDYPNCPTDVNQNGWAVDEAFVGTWGMDPRMRWSGMSATEEQPLNPGMSWNNRRLKLISDGAYRRAPDTDPRKYYTCFRFRGHIVYAERWGNDYNWETNGDEDGNSYVEIDDAQESLINNRERRNLRRWAGARKVADLHAEHVPRDQKHFGGTLNFPCLDWGLGQDTVKHCTKNLEGWGAEKWEDLPPIPPYDSNDPGTYVEFVGPFVYDQNHGYKEVHPIRIQRYGGSTTPETAQPVTLAETCKQLDARGNCAQ